MEGEGSATSEGLLEVIVLLLRGLLTEGLGVYVLMALSVDQDGDGFTHCALPSSALLSCISAPSSLHRLFSSFQSLIMTQNMVWGPASASRGSVLDVRGLNVYPRPPASETLAVGLSSLYSMTGPAGASVAIINSSAPFSFSCSGSSMSAGGIKAFQEYLCA